MTTRTKKLLATLLVLGPLAALSLTLVGPWWTLAAFTVVGLWELAKYTVRRLRAASERINQILDDELGPDRPDTKGEPR